MVERGWSPEHLDAMSEDEFCDWYDEAIELEQAKAEAVSQVNGGRHKSR